MLTVQIIVCALRIWALSGMLGTSTLSGTGNRDLPSVKQSKSKSPSHFKMQIYLVRIL